MEVIGEEMVDVVELGGLEFGEEGGAGVGVHGCGSGGEREREERSVQMGAKEIIQSGGFAYKRRERAFINFTSPLQVFRVCWSI